MVSAPGPWAVKHEAHQTTNVREERTSALLRLDLCLPRVLSGTGREVSLARSLGFSFKPPLPPVLRRNWLFARAGIIF